MSIEIEYAATVNSKEDVVKKSEELKQWIDSAVEGKWNPMSYSNKEIKLFDQPPEGTKHILMSQCTINADAKKAFEFLTHSEFKDQKVYDTDLLVFERAEKFDDEGCEVSRVCYKAPWPVTAREFVSVQNWFEKDGNYYLVQESVNYPKKYTEPTKEYVRGYKKSGLVLKSTGDKQMEAFRVVILDPRGSIPGWVVSTAKKDDAGRLFAMKKYFEEHFAN